MSLLKQIAESSSAVLNNYDANYAVNKLAKLQESFDVLKHPIQYTAAAVPVFIGEASTGTVFLVENENLTKLMKSQNIDEAAALRQIYDVIKEEQEISNMTQLAVVVKEENIEEVYATITESAAKIDARAEAVTKYSDRLEKIMAEGAQIIIG